MSKAKYPAKIFVTREKDSHDPSYLLVHERVSDPAVVDERTEIAIYALERVAIVTAKSKIE